MDFQQHLRLVQSVLRHMSPNRVINAALPPNFLPARHPAAGFFTGVAGTGRAGMRIPDELTCGAFIQYLTTADQSSSFDFSGVVGFWR